MNQLVTRTLEQCEEVIEHGLKTFVEVGNALLEIRDSCLYLQSHGTFEGYCRERWGFTQPRAQQLINSAKVIGNLGDHNNCYDSLPSTESQARPLAKLPPEQQAEAWRQAVETAPNATKDPLTPLLFFPKIVQGRIPVMMMLLVLVVPLGIDCGCIDCSCSCSDVDVDVIDGCSIDDDDCCCLLLFLALSSSLSSSLFLPYPLTAFLFHTTSLESRQNHTDALYAVL